MLAPLGTAESDSVSVEDDEARLAAPAELPVPTALAPSAGLEGLRKSAAMNSVPVTRWIHECLRVLVSSFTCLTLSSATDAHTPDR